MASNPAPAEISGDAMAESHQLSQQIADQTAAAEELHRQFLSFTNFPWGSHPVFRNTVTNAENLKPDGDIDLAKALALRIKLFRDRAGIAIDPAQYRQWQAATKSTSPNLVHPELLKFERENLPAEKRVRTRFVEAEAQAGSETDALTSQDGEGTTTAATAENDDDRPFWQRSAPKQELYVDKSAGGNGTDAAPPFPESFSKIIAHVQSGEPIEGIRVIPDTIINDPSISTTGQLQAPRKPWERNR